MENKKCLPFDMPEVKKIRQILWLKSNVYEDYTKINKTNLTFQFSIMKNMAKGATQSSEKNMGV